MVPFFISSRWKVDVTSQIGACDRYGGTWQSRNEFSETRQLSSYLFDVQVDITWLFEFDIERSGRIPNKIMAEFYRPAKSID